MSCSILVVITGVIYLQQRKGGIITPRSQEDKAFITLQYNLAEA